MFPDTVDELFEEDEYDEPFFGCTAKEIREELSFLRKMRELKESGKDLYTFDQKYVF